MKNLIKVLIALFNDVCFSFQFFQFIIIMLNGCSITFCFCFVSFLFQFFRSLVYPI